MYTFQDDRLKLPDGGGARGHHEGSAAGRCPQEGGRGESQVSGRTDPRARVEDGRSVGRWDPFLSSTLSGSSDLEPDLTDSNFKFISWTELSPPYLLIYPIGLLPEIVLI